MKNKVAVVMVLSASYFLVATFLVIGLNLISLLTKWGENIQATVYFKENASDQQMNQVLELLKKDSRILHLKLIDKESARKDFAQQIKQYAPALLDDPELDAIIPSSINFGLADQSSGSDSVFKEVSEKLKGYDFVESMSWGQDWIKKFGVFVHLINSVGGFLVLVLSSALVFVVGNTIRASIFAKQDYIQVLELVGATKAEIRRPFLVEGFLISGFSSLVGLFIAWLGFVSFTNYTSQELGYFALATGVDFLEFKYLVLFLLGSGLLGALGAYLSVKSINTGWLRKG